MKKILLILLIGNLSAILYPQNFQPLNIGNKWQYLISGYGNGGSGYSLSTISVSETFVVDNKKYFKLSNSDDFIRYSVIDKKIYLYYNNTEHVYVDFNVPADSFYLSFGPWHQYMNILSIGGTDTIFNAIRTYGGYKIANLPVIEEFIFSDSIGLNTKNRLDEFGFQNDNLIESIIIDSLNIMHSFSYHYKPQFELVPVYQISSEDFILNCKVKHQYNRLHGNPPWLSVNFIDSVKMYCFYSKGDSVGFTTSRIPYHDFNITNPNDDYLFEIQLDTSLLKNGYTFNYKIYAKDKGIIPEHNYAPDSDYYQCTWVEPNGTDSKENQQLNYLLSQNYPNPFNPRTTIEYQIPQSSFVTIKAYDALGKEVVTLVNEEKPAGVHEVNFEPKDLTSGLYLYKIKAGSFELTRKMLLLK